ncbi:MAG TPA: sigma-70 family RNA polymerase sigma factor [Steroidobacteraceae bacterium]|nr:sigma-70 family RNA polymerase sigma factor [Steroidobacteraceae bacterium]
MKDWLQLPQNACNKWAGKSVNCAGVWRPRGGLTAIHPLLRSNWKAQMQLIEERLRSLMLPSLAGDATAYRMFLDELTTHLRSYLRRRLGGLPDEIEDLLQELLLAVHNKRHTYDPKQPLTAWVQAIARYKLVDLLRRRSRSNVLNDPLDEDDRVFATTADDAAEAQYDVAKLLRGLPDRQRLPILYVKIEGASVTDTAVRTGMSESAVKVGIHRGLKALAEKIRSID